MNTEKGNSEDKEVSDDTEMLDALEIWVMGGVQQDREREHQILAGRGLRNDGVHPRERVSDALPRSLRQLANPPRHSFFRC